MKIGILYPIKSVLRKNKIGKSIVCVLCACLLLTGCSKGRSETAATEKNVVRIYDVIPQGRENLWIGDGQTMDELELESRSSNPDQQAAAIKELESMKSVTLQQHAVRVGVFTSVGDERQEMAPYVDQIEQIEKESGVEIEYVVFGSWEEVKEEIDRYADENITQMVLLDNSYEGSLTQEALSGRYTDMESMLNEYGFYEDEQYEQVVLQAGHIDGKQVLIPLLYNVSGMIHGERIQVDSETGETTIPEPIQGMPLSFEQFVEELSDEMRQTDENTKKVSYLSSAFLDGKTDLFLTAAGIPWEAYENQGELFEILYRYLKVYEETQMDSQSSGISMQQQYARYLNEYENYCGWDGNLTQKIAVDLGIESYRSDVPVEAYGYDIIAKTLLDQTHYFVECSSVDDIAYHSVLGLLSYSGYYCRGRDLNGYTGGTGYWPIGVLGDNESFAAQPICYAAVVDGGSRELAAKVIKAMMHQNTAVEFGLSVCNETRETQLTQWEKETDLFGKLRSLVKAEDGSYRESNSEQIPYWQMFVGTPVPGNKAEYTEQMRNQLAHITFAQIPDREVLVIWQETLTEAVDSGLSAEAGFELLCQRLSDWYQ